MDKLANIFPFVKNFFVKVLKIINVTDNEWINTPIGLTNLFILLFMVLGVLVLFAGFIIYSTRNINFSGEDESKVAERRHKYRGCFIGGTILLSLPLIAIIVLAIAGATLPLPK